jgi:predicted nucleotide-binding protein
MPSGEGRPTLPHELPSLRRPRAEVEAFLDEQISLGQDLETRAIKNGAEFDAVSQEQSGWSESNIQLLRHCYETTELAEKYMDLFPPATLAYFFLADGVTKFRERVKAKNIHLRKLRSQLKFIQEPSQTNTAPLRGSSRSRGKRVFIVHGHDEGMRESVARYVGALGLEAVILHEQPNLSRTLIEKLEAHADVDFAIVLLSPDDEVVKGMTKDRERRARQNVIFELGLFVGKLGRQRVCALYKQGVELPTDYAGVAYVKFDADDGWRLKLVKELKAAQVPVDESKIA